LLFERLLNAERERRMDVCGIEPERHGPAQGVLPEAGSGTPEADRNWYAVSTVPQNERAVVRHLTMRDVKSFLPTYETTRIWKNRQKKRIVLPLFPTYLFVHIRWNERIKVLQSPGVLRIIGNGREYVPLRESEVEFLRTACQGERIEPYRELVVGEKVRIRSGAMQGIKGTLVRKSESMRFVITLELINQHAAVQVSADNLEPITA
jgi:transcription antitermination factor NusG